MTPANKYESRWRLYLTREGLRRSFRPPMCSMAREACEDGCVEMASIQGMRIMGIVDDGNTHTPMVDMIYNHLSFSCSCEQMAYLDSCIHCVILMTYAADNLDRMLEEEMAAKDRAAYFLSRVSEDKVLEYAAEIMQSDPYMLHRFVEKFGLKNVRPPRDYAGELGRMYARQAGGVGAGRMLDLGLYFKEATERRAGGDHEEAAKMYRDASKQMRLLAGTASDTNGYYTDCCIEAIENMAEAVTRQKPGFEEKRKYIGFLMEEALAASDPKILPHYRGALDIICREPEDLAEWEKMLASRMAEQKAAELECGMPGDCKTPGGGQSFAKAAVSQVPSRESVLKERKRRLAAVQAAQDVLAGMYAHVLAQTGRLDQALSVLEGRAFKNRDLCLAYLRMLRGTGPEKARQGALDAAAAYPDDVQVIEAAIDTTPQDAPERVELLGKAFAATGERGYLQEIKRATDDWESVASDMIEILAVRFMDKAIDVCVKEDMHQKAMEMLEKGGDVGAFKKYLKRLGKAQPDRYMAAYGKALESFAKGRSGREHYQRVADHLEFITGMPSSEEAGRAIAGRIRRQNAGKRSLVGIIRPYCPDRRARAPAAGRGGAAKPAAGSRDNSGSSSGSSSTNPRAPVTAARRAR